MNQGCVTEVVSISKFAPQRRDGFRARISLLYIRIKDIFIWLQSPAKLLPDVQYRSDFSGSLPIKFKDSHGLVSQAKSTAILKHIVGENAVATALRQHLACEQSVNNSAPWILGNRLTLLQNGPETYQAMMTEIQAAKNHINLETYIFDDDEIGKKICRSAARTPSCGGSGQPDLR